MSQPNPHVLDVDETSFEAEVMNFSMHTPVVIDLWASWCGPCKVLGPILEELASEWGGAFRLAKIDVDRNPALAGAFRAQSIPMVVAIHQGQFVDQFMGALPRQEVSRWLDEVFRRVGLQPQKPGAGAPRVPSDPVEALAHWRGRLADKPNDDEARLALGKLLFATGGDVAEAESLLKSIPATADEYNPAQSALKLKELILEVSEAGGEAAIRSALAAEPDDPDARYHVALAEGVAGRYVDALVILVDQVAERDPARSERAKRSAGVLFEAAGRGDEAVEKQRRRLARLLF